MRKSETELAAPAGYIWIDEASRLTGLAVKTLHNYRHTETGPPAVNYRRRLVYKLADVEAWMAEQLAPPPVNPEQLRESRPPEPRLPKRS